MARISTTQNSFRPAGATDEAAEVEEHSEPLNPVLRLLTNPYLTLVSRFILGSIFVLSGLSKITNPSGFADSIRSYEVGLPDAVVNTMSTVLPIVELGIGIWILVGLFTRFAAALAGGLMVVFLIAIAQAWARGIEADCGCFAGAEGAAPTFIDNIMKALGPVGSFLADAQIGPVPIIRDLIFLLLAVHLFLVPTIWSLDRLRAKYQ